MGRLSLDYGMAKRAVFAFAGIALLFVLIFYYSIRWAPGRTDYPVQGIDVSQENGKVIWPAVAGDDIDFAYLKATEGAEFYDTQFAQNWADAHKNGVKRGAYHLFSLCRLASDQATNFIAHVPRDPTALAAAVQFTLDENCENRPDRDVLIREIAAFVQAGEAHTGKPMLLYVTSEFESVYQISEAIDRQLWLRSMAFPPSFGGREWAVWQASAIRRVKGIEGPVNWNVLRK